MTAETEERREAAPTIVWIDARHAAIARWTEPPLVERHESDVPAHHHAMGHVRIDPGTRHGGGGPVEDRVEGGRLEHLRQFLEVVSRRVPVDCDVHVLGPGSVRHDLRRRLATDDARHGRSRLVVEEAAEPMTDHQLLARARELAGDPAPRQRPAAARNG